MSKNQNASSASKAIDDVDNKDNKDDKEVKEGEESQESSENEEGEENEDEENEEGSEAEGEEEDDVNGETAQAVRLFRALNDPNMGPAVIAHLAQQRGINLPKGKSGQQDFIDEIEDLVKAELGPEFTVFGGKLSNILKKIVPAVAQLETNKVRNEFAGRENDRLAREVGVAMTEVFDQFQLVPNSIRKVIGRLMDEMPPVPGKTDPKKYFQRMIQLAQTETGVKLKSKSNSKSNSEDNSDKSNRNKRDAVGRLASDRSSEVRTSKDGRPKQFKGRRDAIDQAMKDVEKAIESGKLKI